MAADIAEFRSTRAAGGRWKESLNESSAAHSGISVSELGTSRAKVPGGAGGCSRYALGAAAECAGQYACPGSSEYARRRPAQPSQERNHRTEARFAASTRH